jgi:succinate dehydrogenase hydrophobic anchor subunit
VWLLSWPIVAIPLLLFTVTVCVAMRAAAQNVIERHVGEPGLRSSLIVAVTFAVAAFGSTMIYAILRINFAV